jgi:hypothetical protein
MCENLACQAFEDYSDSNYLGERANFGSSFNREFQNSEIDTELTCFKFELQTGSNFFINHHFLINKICISITIIQ